MPRLQDISRHLPRNPGAPDDKISFPGTEVDRVMLLPLQKQMFRKAENSIDKSSER